MSTKRKILVLCTGNSCRSQIAEGYLRFYGEDEVEVYSAGIEAHGINQRAVKVMMEDGIDISKHTSDVVDRFTGINFDYVITVCDNASERCPYFPSSAIKMHHNFPDPAKATGSEEEIMKQFRNVRNMIKEYSKQFIENNI